MMLTTPTGRLLLSAFRGFEAALLNELKKEGYHDVAPSHMNLLRHLNQEGMSLTELAQDAQISKQAVGKMISELVENGYVLLVEDPKDRRAKIVTYSSKGKDFMVRAVFFVTEMEGQYKAELGEIEYLALRDTLKRIITLHQTKES